MIKLITINNPRTAQAFIDYMASRKIELDMMPEGGGQFAIWLKNDADKLEAESELSHFLAAPNDGKYQAASWDLADSRTRKFKYHTPSILGMVKAKAGPLTLLIMSVSIGLFILFQIGFGDSVFSVTHFPAQEGQQWQIWRWVSHALIHFSVAHIAFNLLWWWQLGGDIEKRLGSVKLLQIFIFSSALSGAGQYWVEGANFGGLSGVVYALMGYSWLLGVISPQKGVSLPKPIVIFMLIWLVLGFIQPYMAIANTAHLVGLGAGLLLALIDSQMPKKSHG
ncbi:rhomboid family intramembrane serine protease GlpG [Vibrio algarum]|uniref:Rhomboid family intramembrane serine protease GlpG n=1 Tax=Vibrio algarum TaxID=3020714 RepID=A0ABT4YNN4_9VIBR|nr:rhomboid family intramembrane serine protease GlpG [Vibrio sp. KJ40-1]MDB1122684.1 rhomboid family intramembrane serine protease GlpG [Vibrio sp. KJ40-1]